MRYFACIVFLALLSISCVGESVAALPRADEQISVNLPDYGAELRAFDEQDREPVKWWPHVINAAWGEGRGGPERNGDSLQDLR